MEATSEPDSVRAATLSGWQNALVEIFNGSMREEILNLEVFDPSSRPRGLLEEWMADDNTCRPYRSRQMLTRLSRGPLDAAE